MLKVVVWAVLVTPVIAAQAPHLPPLELAAAGLAPGYVTFANTGRGWEQVRGTLRLGGVRLPVIDAGRGRRGVHRPARVHEAGRAARRS